MRALFLGSNGRVGRLLKSGWTRDDVTPIWHSRSTGDTVFDILTDTDALKAAIGSSDVVINLAGTTHHAGANIGSENAELAKTVLDCAGDTPVFLFSSAAVYGTAPGVLSENSHPTPASDYGRDKAAMEDMAQNHAARSIILRLGNVAGADALLGVDREHYTLDQFPDGSYPQRSYIGPKQLANTLADLILIHRDVPKVLNVAAPGAVSMHDLLNSAGKPWSPKSAGPNAIAKVELSTTLLESLTAIPTSASQPQSIVEDWRSVRAAT